MSGSVPRELLDAFLEEAKGFLPSIRKGPRDFLANDPSPDSLRESHRLIHIIKGAASMVGLTDISHQANALETVLEGLVYGGGQRGPSEVEAAIRATIGVSKAYGANPSSVMSRLRPNASLHPIREDAWIVKRSAIPPHTRRLYPANFARRLTSGRRSK